MPGDDNLLAPRKHRATCMGSFEFADKYGVHGCPKMIVVDRSKICDGIGLFAQRFIRKGTPITRYCGRSTADHKRLTSVELSYTYMLCKRSGRRTYIVGNRNLKKLSGRGVGQLANDAIHVEVTGQRNNCVFIERGNKVYVAAKRDIYPGEELLVSYHISYWISTVRAADDVAKSLPGSVLFWINCHKELEDLLRKHLVHEHTVCIEDYIGVIEQEKQSEKEKDGIAEYLISLVRERPSPSQTTFYESMVPHCNCLVCPKVITRWQIQVTSKLELNVNNSSEEVLSTRLCCRCVTCEQKDFVHLGEVPGV